MLHRSRTVAVKLSVSGFVEQFTSVSQAEHPDRATYGNGEVFLSSTQQDADDREFNSIFEPIPTPEPTSAGTPDRKFNFKQIPHTL